MAYHTKTQDIILPLIHVTHSVFLLFQDKTGCTASAGFGSNCLQARLATKKAKPNGQFHLEPSSVSLFMHDIMVEDLPGNERNCR
jgi:hypothetical protein